MAGNWLEYHKVKKASPNEAHFLFTCELHIILEVILRHPWALRLIIWMHQKNLNWGHSKYYLCFALPCLLHSWTRPARLMHGHRKFAFLTTHHSFFFWLFFSFFFFFGLPASFWDAIVIWNIDNTWNGLIIILRYEKKASHTGEEERYGSGEPVDPRNHQASILGCYGRWYPN